MENIRKLMKETWEMLKAKGLFLSWNSYEDWLERDKKNENQRNKLSNKSVQSSEPKQDRSIPPSLSLFR